MLDIVGIKINEFPFKELKLVCNLMSFEGTPFLCHYQDWQKRDVLSYLVDEDERCHRWLYLSVSNDELNSYLVRSNSLAELLLKSVSDLKFFVEFNYEGEFVRAILNQGNLDPKYLPESDSYFPLEIPDVYTEQVKKFNVINTFLESGVFIKAEARTKEKDHGLVRAIDGSSLLSAFGLSWERKVEQEAERKFLESKITDKARIKKATNEIISLYPMKIAKLKVASFSVGLYTNPINNVTESNILTKDWLLKILNDFKENVVEIDTKSIEQVAAITGQYQDATRLKDIYEPLLKLYENKHISVSLTDKDFKTRRVLKPVTEEIKSRLLIYKSKKEISEETADRVIKTKINLKTNKPIIAAGFTLFDLETSASWETERIDYEGIVYKLTFPLTFKYSKENDVIILENKLLDIYATGEGMTEVITDVCRQFHQVYQTIFVEKLSQKLTPLEDTRRKFFDILVSK
jgi:hypothetical protein